MSVETRQIRREWPNLKDECFSMLQHSILVYGFVDLRSLQKKGKLISSEPSLLQKLKDLPLKAKEAQQILIENREKLNPDESVVECLKRTQKMEKAGEEGLSEIVVFDDKNVKDALVYGITVLHSQKRITVVFRGSTTAFDWWTDAQMKLCDRPNPLRGSGLHGVTKTIRVHHGFDRYMFAKDTEGGCSKYEAIFNHLILLLEEYPGYSVYVTGHR